MIMKLQPTKEKNPISLTTENKTDKLLAHTIHGGMRQLQAFKNNIRVCSY